VLDSVLRHEFLHLLIEMRARADTPLWLREGLVLWLNGNVPKSQYRFLTGERIDRMLRSPANQSELRAAYAAAEARVAMLVQKNGRAVVIGWLSGGLPAELRRR
jgi:stage II sporulation protein D